MKGTEKIRRNILITGGTGFLGKAVIARLALLPEYEKVFLLVRKKNGQSADRRVAKIIERMFPQSRWEQLKSKILAFGGELTAPGLGLEPKDEMFLLKNVNQILHVGASTDFGAPLGEARLNNVEGTRHTLEFAQKIANRSGFQRYDYVSTAFVAGRLKGFVNEDDLNRGQEFSNSYEQSKYEAEILVKRFSQKGLPVSIYRPSIVVGDSNSGYTPHFKVLYWPLLLLARNLIPFFPCNQNAFLDVVPVDFVADSLVALMRDEKSLGETFHLTAGLGNEIRIRQVLKDAYQIAAIKKRPTVPFWLFALIRNTSLARYFDENFWETVQLALPYEHYLRGSGARFNAERTLRVLQSLGVSQPTWSTYKREILSYCRASRWGKKLPMPEYIYYLPVSTKKETWRELANRKFNGAEVVV